MKTLLSRWITTISRVATPRDFSDTRCDAAAPELQALCLQLIEGVTPGQHLARALREARRSSDFWHLRAALFGTIALSLGEGVARERIAQLDALLG